MNRKFMAVSVAFACVALLISTISLSTVSGESSSAEEKKAKPAKAKGPGASLHGYRFEFPCKGKMPDKPRKGADCASALVKGDPNKTDNFKTTRKFGGDKGKSYDVTLRFRGVVEPGMRLLFIAKLHRLRSTMFTYFMQGFVERKLVFETEVIGVAI